MHIRQRKHALYLVLSLLAAAALFAAFYVKRGNEGISADEKEAAFVLAIDEADAALLSHLHEGDRVVDRQSRRILGDIIEIRSSKSVSEIYSEARGALVEAPVPDRLKILLTIKAAEHDGRVLTQGGDTVRLGQTYHFRTYDFSGEGRVVAFL